MNDTKSAPLIPPRMGTPMDPAHEADLHRSYLTDKTIQEAQIKSARREDIPMILGFDPPGIQSLCLFPYLGTPGNFFRAKVYPPPVDGAKYYQRQGTRSHLYIPPSVRKLLSNPAEPLTIVEGEKKTLRAIQEGLPAVGIGGLWSFQKDKKLIPEFESIAYVRREVVFYPDSDVWSRPDLLRPVYALAWELENRGAVIHVGILTPGPNGEKRGLDDYPNLEIDLAHNIIKGLKYVGLKDKTFAIPREWHATWKKDDNQDSTLQGQPLFQREVNPWRTPVNGQKLLEDLTAKIRQYVVLSDEAAVAAALWIIQTYCPDLMTCLAILAVTSTTKREGKTTLLEITTATCAKPVPTTNISSAALFRSIEGWGPTLICDEMDKQFKENDDLRTLFNAGHTRTTAFVIRVVGDKLEPRAFNIFGPKAVGLIGKLPPTMQDRSIEIRMRRKDRGQKISRIVRTGLEKECAALRSQIVRWLEDNKDKISEETATPPFELDDRAADNWRGLFALASAVGGPWPEKAKEAALGLSEIRKEDIDFGEELLGDLQEIFGEQLRMFTSEVVTKLNEKDDRPWPTALKGKPINAHWLARRLKPFGIKPLDIRYGDIVLKGYFREGPMEKAFETYLTPPQSNRYTATNEQNQEDTEQSNRYKEDVCSDYDGQLTMQEESFRSDCSDVADRIGGVEGEGEIKAEAEDTVWEHFQREQRERDRETRESEMTEAEAQIWNYYFQG